LEGSLDISPGVFCTCLEVFPCIIAGGPQLLKFRFGCILLALRFYRFLILNLRLGLGFVCFSVKQSDLGAPFLQLRIKFLFVCFSVIRHGPIFYPVFLLPLFHGFPVVAVSAVADPLGIVDLPLGVVVVNALV